MHLRPELATLVVALAGCNAVFGLGATELIDGGADDDGGAPEADRDRDGIPDSQDPCIESIADRLGDYEGDAEQNDTDGCPFDYESYDTDGDTIFDECDPFVTLAGDRRRCIMTFANPTINRELWTPRGDPAAWNVLLSRISAVSDGTIVAGESFEGPVTTSYDMVGYFQDPIAPATQAAVTLWLRTGEAATAADVGCELRGDGSATTLSILGAQPAASVATTEPLMRMQKLAATLEPTQAGANVTCGVVFLGSTGLTRFEVRGTAALSPGHVAFQVESTRGSFQGLAIYERDDAPAL